MIVGILLAAGRGTRFGSHKLLHLLPDGTPIVVAALRNLAQGADEVIAVVRPDDAALMQLLAREHARVLPCPTAELGIGASLACGVRAAPNADAWLIAPADMPFIASATMSAVVQQLRTGTPLVAPSYQDQRGHPVGFAAEFFPALSTLTGDSGAKSVIETHRLRLQLIPCDDPGVLRDIDVQSDLLNNVTD